MAENKTNPGFRTGSRDETVLTTPEGYALPRVLDPVVTMDLVQRYVETERLRTRRVFLWMSTVFLTVVLGVLALFISVGIYLLRNSKKATQIAEDMRVQSEVVASQMTDVSGKVRRLETGQKEIGDAVEKREVQMDRENRMFKRDLERFGRWVASSRGREKEDLMGMLEGRLKQVETSTAAKERELAQLRSELAAWKNEGGGVRAAGAGVDRASTAAAVNVSPAAAGSARVTDSGAPSTRTRAATVGETARVGGEDPPLSDEIIGDISDKDVPPDDDWERIVGGPKGEVSVVSFPNGDRYEGEFKNGLFNGWGTYAYANGDRYEGEFLDDMKSGRGVLTYANGDKYFGQFRSNMRVGMGRMLFRNGDRYVGRFGNDMMDGKGTLLYQNANKYVGDFKNGVKHGNGVFRFSNGDLYKGEFKDDQRHGRGVYVFANGAKYIGEFRDGKRSGHGRYIYEDGSEYVGDFKDGKKEGRGTCVYPDGKQFTAIWKDDKEVKQLE